MIPECDALSQAHVESLTGLHHPAEGGGRSDKICHKENKDAKRTTMLIGTILYLLEHVEPFKNILDLFRTIWEHFETF